jgi:hypothetical protein
MSVCLCTAISIGLRRLADGLNSDDVRREPVFCPGMPLRVPLETATESDHPVNQKCLLKQTPAAPCRRFSLTLIQLNERLSPYLMRLLTSESGDRSDRH